MKLTRQFTQKDQAQFAAASGDYNPMHMDPLAARRTQAGAPVVHGIHNLLWLIDTIAREHQDLPALATAKVRFSSMVYVDEAVEARLTLLDDKGLRAEVLAGGAIALTFRAVFGKTTPQAPAPDTPTNMPLVSPAMPLDVSLGEIANCSGRLLLPDETLLEKMFPHAARYIGVRRVAAIARSSYLVGMVVPGLHSIYATLAFALCEDSSGDLWFKVASAEPERPIFINMTGGGLAAELETFLRMPPVRQAGIDAVAGHVGRDEFSGTTALVVGGSRGLGELTAKIIAAGGGDVVITYARGKSDAERVAAEIAAWGGKCQTLAYDVMSDAGGHLVALNDVPSHIYYFSTPPLKPRKSETFDADHYKEFCGFYVTGFEKLIGALSKKESGPSVFYPSSVAIDEPPAGMAEYARAKEAGEKLCADLMKRWPALRIVSSRLPRMLTDLTATVQPVRTADPLEIMLPIIREMQARPDLKTVLDGGQ